MLGSFAEMESADGQRSTINRGEFLRIVPRTPREHNMGASLRKLITNNPERIDLIDAAFVALAMAVFVAGKFG